MKDVNTYGVSVYLEDAAEICRRLALSQLDFNCYPSTSNNFESIIKVRNYKNNRLNARTIFASIYKEVTGKQASFANQKINFSV